MVTKTRENGDWKLFYSSCIEQDPTLSDNLHRGISSNIDNLIVKLLERSITVEFLNNTQIITFLSSTYLE